MTICVPAWVDEMIDPTDPLTLLLAKEGSNDEAYQTAQQYRSGTVQITLHAEIEDTEERETDHGWVRRTRRMSSKATITRGVSR